MEILKPADPGYTQASNTFMGQGTPKLIYLPQTAEGVAQAIKSIVADGLALSVKSGGHSNSGFSTNDGGAVIDLSQFREIEILDHTKGLVQIGSGVTWGEVALTLQSHGLAITSGDTKTVGVGGLATGGGIGWMVRKYGLTIDSLVSAQVVTADGQVLSVSQDDNADLFWAIRGGGGNFGIVTNFVFHAQPITSVYAGTLVYPHKNIGRLLTSWRDHMRVADESLTTIINILPSFMGKPPMAALTCCYAGDDEKAAQLALDPLRKLGGLESDSIVKKSYAEVLEDAHPSKDMQIIVNNNFFEMSGQVIKGIDKLLNEKPDTILQIRFLGGAVGRIAPSETAYYYRQSEALIICPVFLPPKTDKNKEDQALKPWSKLAALGSGSYGNLLSVVGPQVTGDIYPPAAYHKLAIIKKKYDPKNVFKLNHNILPSG